MTGRVALVTGGTRGLGAAVSEALASREVTVVAVFRVDRGSADSLQERCGGHLKTLQVDVTDPAACTALVNEVVAAHGRLDYLVNNAGAVHESRVGEIGTAQWRASLDLNLSAAFYLSQAVLVPMRAQGFGRIVNVSSVSATMGSSFQVDYAAAKAGLVGLTRSMARAAARSSVTVNCLMLGGFETDLLDGLTHTDRSVIEASIPVGRFGRPEEFAHAVLSLLDEDASYITGATLAVDGGLAMGQ